MSSSVEVAKKLGLNEYESKAYLSLLSQGSATASTISSLSSIPRARVYDVLTSLEKKGFVEKKPVKPVTYSAVQPSFAVKKIESAHRQGFEDSMKELSTLASMLEKQVSLNEVSADGGEVVLISGWHNIASKISQKLSEAKSEVVFSAMSLDAIKRKKQFFSKELGELERKGVKVRFKRAASRFVLFDNGSVLVFLNPNSHDAQSDQALFLENEFVAKIFWKK